MTPVEVNEQVPTAGTDGAVVVINEDFWRTLSYEEQVAIFLHEMLHLALLHVPRRGMRDPALWNIAADIVVNGILVESGFYLPNHAIREQELERFSVEEVFDLLQKRIPEDLPLLRMPDLLKPDPQQKLDQIRHYWEQALQRAEIQARVQGQGTIPGALRRHITPGRGQLDWRSYLWRFLTATPTDFQGYDRRFVSQGLYLDDLAGEKITVAVALDTSGSIDTREAASFLGEVRSILGVYPHIEVQLYFADSACYGPYTLINESQPLPEAKGGGGTSFCPFFEKVAVQQERLPAACVYLTDGYGDFPDKVPTIPTLWVVSPGGLDSDSFPFGEVIRLSFSS